MLQLVRNNLKNKDGWGLFSSSSGKATKNRAICRRSSSIVGFYFTILQSHEHCNKFENKCDKSSKNKVKLKI